MKLDPDFMSIYVYCRLSLHLDENFTFHIKETFFFSLNKKNKNTIKTNESF